MIVTTSVTQKRLLSCVGVRWIEGDKQKLLIEMCQSQGGAL